MPAGAGSAARIQVTGYFAANCSYSVLPNVRQAWKQRNGAAVLEMIGQGAPLRHGAKAVLIFAMDKEVIRVEREDGVFRSVTANPQERPVPGVRRVQAGPLHVRAEIGRAHV